MKIKLKTHLLVIFFLLSVTACNSDGSSANNNSDTLLYEVHIIVDGESLSKIADVYDVDLQELKRINNISESNRITAGSELKIRIKDCNDRSNGPCIKTHIVRSGETLTKIAEEQGTLVRLISELNCILNEDEIYIGQELNIPSENNDADPLGFYLDCNSDSFEISVDLTDNQIGKSIEDLPVVQSPPTPPEFPSCNLDSSDISGSITDSRTKEPIENAQLIVLIPGVSAYEYRSIPDKSDVMFITQSDLKGYYEIPSLANYFKYILLIDTENYKEKSKEIDLDNNCKQEVLINITLEK